MRPEDRTYRRIKTTQERKRNASERKFVRGKRKKLPNSWDDIHISKRQKCWKERRATQCRGPKGIKITLTLDVWYIVYHRVDKGWELEEQLELNKVPYRKLEIRGKRRYWSKHHRFWKHYTGVLKERYIFFVQDRTWVDRLLSDWYKRGCQEFEIKEG